MKIVAIHAGLSEESSTRLLANRLLSAATESARAAGESVETELVQLRPLAHAITDAMLTGFASGELAAAIETVRSADAVVAVTPVFTASYSGLFKSFFDVLEPGMLEGVPVLLAATGGTGRHSLVLDHAMRPLFGYLKALSLPTAVFAATDDWGDDTALQSRIARAADELVRQLAGSARTRRASGPVFDESAEGFADFASLLAG